LYHLLLFFCSYHVYQVFSEDDESPPNNVSTQTENQVPNSNLDDEPPGITTSRGPRLYLENNWIVEEEIQPSIVKAYPSTLKILRVVSI